MSETEIVETITHLWQRERLSYVQRRAPPIVTLSVRIRAALQQQLHRFSLVSLHCSR